MHQNETLHLLSIINNSNPGKKSPAYSHISLGWLQKQQWMKKPIYMGHISKNVIFVNLLSFNQMCPKFYSRP